MPDDSVICRFILTDYEFRRAHSASWRYGWRKFFVLALFLLFLWAGPLQVYWEQTAALQPDDPERPSLFTSFFNDIFPLLIFGTFLVYLMVFLPRRLFRKGVAYNKEVVWCLDESGVQWRSPLMGVDAQWPAVSRLLETRHGFLLSFAGNAGMNWLPKSGFESKNAIDQVRVLARKYVKKTKLLNGS